MSSNYRRQKRNYSGNAGHEAALRHIQEAKEFSHEIGCYDRDVKEYFFNLPWHELDVILKEYGIRFGVLAEDYARQTFSKWRNGKTQMSGLVAKRLFSLLPPKMSERKKYELAENIWKHFGPTSSHDYIIGEHASVNELARVVADKLDEVVQPYSIPPNIKNRFHWLSAGDVQMEEQLLNHFRQEQKKLVIQEIFLKIPLLQQQMQGHPDTTGKLRSVLEIHKHTVNIEVDRWLGDAITRPKLVTTTRRTPANTSQRSPEFLTALKWVVFLVILYALWSLIR